MQQTNKPQYRSLKNILIIAASFLLLISAGAACTEDKEATQSDLILAQIGTADKDILDQTGEEIVVYAVDIESLGQSLSLATNQEDKIDAATKYIRNRNDNDVKTKRKLYRNVKGNGIVTETEKKRRHKRKGN